MCRSCAGLSCASSLKHISLTMFPLISTSVVHSFHIIFFFFNFIRKISIAVIRFACCFQFETIQSQNSFLRKLLIYVGMNFFSVCLSNFGGQSFKVTMFQFQLKNPVCLLFRFVKSLWCRLKGLDFWWSLKISGRVEASAYLECHGYGRLLSLFVRVPFDNNGETWASSSLSFGGCLSWSPSAIRRFAISLLILSACSINLTSVIDEDRECISNLPTVVFV